jgi:hypothetical protein
MTQRACAPYPPLGRRDEAANDDFLFHQGATKDLGRIQLLPVKLYVAITDWDSAYWLSVEGKTTVNALTPRTEGNAIRSTG